MRWSDQRVRCCFRRRCRYLNNNQLTGTIPSTVRQLTVWYDFAVTASTSSHSVCSGFESTCLVSECLLRRRLFSPAFTGMRLESLSVPLLQPSSCRLHSRQFANDCDDKRVDNSSGDEHNDVDVRNCCWRDNCPDKCASVFHADEPWPLVLNHHQHGRDAAHLHRQHAADCWCRRWVAPVSCSRRCGRLFSSETSSCATTACRETRCGRDEVAAAIQLRCDQRGPAQRVRSRSTRFQRPAGAIQLRCDPGEIFRLRQRSDECRRRSSCVRIQRRSTFLSVFNYEGCLCIDHLLGCGGSTVTALMQSPCVDRVRNSRKTSAGL